MKNKPTKISKGLSISKDLLTKTLARAKNEDRSFSYIVCRAIKRDLTRNS
jgi:predicted CopG family antitoxin